MDNNYKKEKNMNKKYLLLLNILFLLIYPTNNLKESQISSLKLHTLDEKNFITNLIALIKKFFYSR